MSDTAGPGNLRIFLITGSIVLPLGFPVKWEVVNYRQITRILLKLWRFPFENRGGLSLSGRQAEAVKWLVCGNFWTERGNALKAPEAFRKFLLPL